MAQASRNPALGMALDRMERHNSRRRPANGALTMERDHVGEVRAFMAEGGSPAPGKRVREARVAQPRSRANAEGTLKNLSGAFGSCCALEINDASAVDVLGVPALTREFRQRRMQVLVVQSRNADAPSSCACSQCSCARVPSSCNRISGSQASLKAPPLPFETPPLTLQAPAPALQDAPVALQAYGRGAKGYGGCSNSQGGG
jgi:hypothetical protein